MPSSAIPFLPPAASVSCWEHESEVDHKNWINIYTNSVVNGLSVLFHLYSPLIMSHRVLQRCNGAVRLGRAKSLVVPLFASLQGRELGIIVLYIFLSPHLTMQLKSQQVLSRPSPNPLSPLSQCFCPLNVVFNSFSVSQNLVHICYIGRSPDTHCL